MSCNLVILLPCHIVIVRAGKNDVVKTRHLQKPKRGKPGAAAPTAGQDLTVTNSTVMIEAVQIKGDLKAEVLLSGEVAQEREVRDQMSGRFVDEHVVDASGAWALSAAVPVLVGTERGGACVGKTISSVGPARKPKYM